MEIDYTVFSDIIYNNGVALGKPVGGLFELTSRCNLRCKMCYVCGVDDHKALEAKELTTEQWITMGKQASDAGVLFLTLTGGEIFIRKDFWEIYEAFTRMGFIITLFTNGTLLSDDMIGRLAKLPPLKVSITVYGASPETYEKVTGHPEAYEKVISNIKKLTEAGLKVELKTTVIKHNAGEFEQLARLARSMGHNLGVVNYISPRREGTGTDPLANRLEPQELADYEQAANDVAKVLYDESKKGDAPKDVIVKDIMAEPQLDRAFSIHDISLAEKTAFRCYAGRCGFWVSWEGKMFPCGLLSEVQADALRLGFGEAWKEIHKKCAEVPSSQECEACEYFMECMACPARRKLETGDYTKPVTYLCEHVKARKAILHN